MENIIKKRMITWNARKMLRVIIPVAFGAMLAMGCKKEVEDAPGTPAVDTNTAITAFEITGPGAAVTGTIKQFNISVSVPAGTDRTQLTAHAVVSEGAEITPDPAEAADYTGSVRYIVTAADKEAQAVYTVTVTSEPPLGSAEAMITTWTAWIDGSEEEKYTGLVNNEHKTVTVFLPYGKSFEGIKAKAVLPAGATIDPDPGAVWDSGASKKFIVTAENGTTVPYMVTLIQGADITGFVFTAPAEAANIQGAVDREKNEITVIVPAATNTKAMTAEITVSPEGRGQITPAPTDTQDYSDAEKPVTFKLTADGQDDKTYKIIITKPSTTRRLAAPLPAIGPLPKCST